MVQYLLQPNARYSEWINIARRDPSDGPIRFSGRAVDRAGPVQEHREQVSFGRPTDPPADNEITVRGRDTVAHATVCLGLLDPSTQGLGNTADLGCNGGDRTRLRLIRALMLKHHTGGAGADLRRVAICHFAFCQNHHPYLN